ncbi:MAG: hemolysin family protein [Treponema sp.]|jgi:putative hemolysin|nr:hemolysin family protein [Treponema sp.]
MEPLIAITLAFLLIITSGIFTLFDSAINLCKKSRLEKERSLRYKAVLKALEDSSDGLLNILTDRQNLSLACRLWCNMLRVLAVLFTGMSLINRSYLPSVFIIISTLVLGILITLLSDVLPKFISRTKPEKITAFFLPVMKIISIPMIPITLPVLKLVSFFNSAIRSENDEHCITEEQLQDDLRFTLLEGEKSGIVDSKERSMVEGVFYLGDRPVAAFMTHRSEIQLFDINTPYDEVRQKALEHRSQRCYPVVDGSPDEIAGVVYLEDIILAADGLRKIMKKAQFVPETMTALKAFESFKQGQADFLLVMDEYGGLAGIISIRALVEEIVGELSATAASEKPLIVQEDGSYLADGTLNIDDAAKELSLTELGEGDDFHTIAGFILHLAGELPGIGDHYEYQGYKFTVKEMDGNRIDKLLITKIEPLPVK